MAKAPPSAPVVSSLGGASMPSTAATLASTTASVVSSLGGVSSTPTGGHYNNSAVSEDMYDRSAGNPYDRGKTSASSFDSFSSGQMPTEDGPKYNISYSGYGEKKKAEEAEKDTYRAMSKKLAKEKAEMERIASYQNAVNEKNALISSYNSFVPDPETGIHPIMDRNSFNAQIMALNQKINQLASNKTEETYIDHGTT